MKTPKPILERRRFVRLAEYLPFEIGHEGYEIKAQTLNISSTGALCRVEREIPLMTKVRIGLALAPVKRASAKPITLNLNGVVVRKEKDPRTDHFLIAVYFSGIKPRDQNLLGRYVEERLKNRS